MKRFNKGQDMVSPSLRKLIYQDFNYYVLNDRNQYFFDSDNPLIGQIPKRVAEHLSVDYLFHDMLKKFQRFFNATFCEPTCQT